MKPIVILFLIVFVDLVGFGILIPLLLSIPEQKGSIHRRNSPQFSGTGTALAHVLPIELTRAKARWPQVSIDAVGLLRGQVLVLRL